MPSSDESRGRGEETHASLLCESLGITSDAYRRHVASLLASNATAEELGSALVSFLQSSRDQSSRGGTNSGVPIVRCPNCDEPYDLLSISDLNSIACAFCGKSFEPAACLEGEAESSALRVGRFRLVRSIGSGGFGTVWEAFDTELEYAVAIKFPHGVLTTASERQRFRNEAKAIAKLNHSHILRILDVDTHRGIPYIVTEFVPGGTLEEELASTRPALKRGVELATKLADALSHAHDSGVIHRDLKPRNILLDLAGEPKIADFGLAKLADSKAELTCTDQRVGTALYMAPEQVRGESRAADGRADVYSLGMILYELIAHTVPFHGSEADILAKTLSATPPDSPRRHNPAVPRDLETIALCCLEKSPENRYQSAADLLGDLERYQSGKPISRRPLRLDTRVWRFCRRHPIPAVLTAALSVTVLLSALALTSLWRSSLRSDQERSLAQLENLLTAPPPDAAALVAELSERLAPIKPQVLQLLESEDLSLTEEIRLRSVLATQSEESLADLVKVTLDGRSRLDDIELVKAALRNTGEQRAGTTVSQASLEASTEDVRFRAALLGPAAETPAVEAETAELVLRGVLAELDRDPGAYPAAIRLLSPYRRQLVSHVVDLCSSRDEPLVAKRYVTSIATEFLPPILPATGERGAAPRDLACLLAHVTPWQAERICQAVPTGARLAAAERLYEHATLLSAADEPEAPEQLAMSAVGCLLLDSPSRCWDLLRTSDSSETRAKFSTYSAGIAGLSPQLEEQAAVETDPLVLAALLISLAETEGRRHDPALQVSVLHHYQAHAHPGVHAAAEYWLTRSEGGLHGAAHGQPSAAAPDEAGPASWSWGPSGHIMTRLPAGTFLMGSQRQPKRGVIIPAPQHERVIRFPFAIAQKETTIGQYESVVGRRRDSIWDGLPKVRPANAVSWLEAANYCNRLSAKAGVAESDWCYVEDKELGGLKAAPNALSRTGYRLPTEAEWEYACRASSTTETFFGGDDELLTRYAWCPSNSDEGEQHPVGLLRPNDWGLFDILGNAAEWCHDKPAPYPGDPLRPTNADKARVLRGAAAGDVSGFSSSTRNAAPVNIAGMPGVGFRICRTLATDE